MPVVETFTAYDEQKNAYEIVVFETSNSPVASGSASVKDYSIAETGEVLEIVQGRPLILRRKETGTLVVDIRGA